MHLFFFFTLLHFSASPSCHATSPEQTAMLSAGSWAISKVFHSALSRLLVALARESMAGMKSEAAKRPTATRGKESSRRETAQAGATTKRTRWRTSIHRSPGPCVIAFPNTVGNQCFRFASKCFGAVQILVEPMTRRKIYKRSLKSLHDDFDYFAYIVRQASDC